MTGGAGRRAKRDHTAGKGTGCCPQLTWFRTVREESRMGIGCGSEGAKTELQSTYPIALRCRQKIHEVAGCLPVFLAFKRHIEIGGGPEHVQERPQRKALAPVVFEHCGRSATRPQTRKRGWRDISPFTLRLRLRQWFAMTFFQ